MGGAADSVEYSEPQRALLWHRQHAIQAVTSPKMNTTAGSSRSAHVIAMVAFCAMVASLRGGPSAPDLPKSPGHYAVDVWQVEEGLPDNRITAIAQTPDGYLWFGTYNGLVRFDGVRFTVFDGRTPGLQSGRIASLFSDSAGALWVGMEYGEL